MHPRSKDLSGLVLAAAGFGLLTGCDVVLKWLAADHSKYQLLAVNSLFAAIAILSYAALTGGVARLSTRRLGMHMVRATAGALSMLAGIYAYTRLSLTDFYAIIFAGPLLVTGLSAVFLKEKVERARWVAIGVGFMGVLIVANPFQTEGVPEGSEILIGRCCAFVSVFCYALSVLMVRHMRGGEVSMSFSFYGHMLTIICGGLLWFLRDTSALSLGDIADLALSGMLSGFGSLCLMEAYHRAPVALVAPFQYTQILWGAIASYMLWDLVPGYSLVLGASIVAVSGLVLLYREIQQKN